MPTIAIICTAMLCSAPQTKAATPLHITDMSLTGGTKAYSVGISYPKTGNATIDAILSRNAHEAFNQAISDFKKDPPSSSDPGYPWDYEINYRIERNDGDVLAVRYSLYSDSGGAHPFHSVSTSNFLVSNGTQVDISSLLHNRQALTKLSQIVIPKLTASLIPAGESTPDMIETGAKPTWDNYANFIALPDALRIVFDWTQVSDYVSGPQHVDVPYPELANLLTVDLQSSEPSFDCAKASTAIEHIICGNLALAKLDREVAQAYKDDLDTTDDSKAMMRNQRSWLKQRDTECEGSAKSEVTTCLLRSYHQQLSTLQQAQ